MGDGLTLDSSGFVVRSKVDGSEACLDCAGDIKVHERDMLQHAVQQQGTSGGVIV